MFERCSTVVIEAIYRYNFGTTQVRSPDAKMLPRARLRYFARQNFVVNDPLLHIRKRILCFALILNYFGDFGYILNIDLRRILAYTIVCCIE